GGEPLSNVHVYEIIRQLHSHHIWTKLITSGIPLTKANVIRLKEAGLDQIALSLDALTPETNDLTRGAGAFAHFATARQNLGREIPMVSLSLSVSTVSLPQLDNLAEFCQRWDVDEAYLSTLRAVDNIRYPPGVAPLSRPQITEMHLKAEQVN